LHQLSIEAAAVGDTVAEKPKDYGSFRSPSLPLAR